MGGGQIQRRDDTHGSRPQVGAASRGSDVDHVGDTEGLIQQEVGGKDQIKVKT